MMISIFERNLEEERENIKRMMEESRIEYGEYGEMIRENQIDKSFQREILSLEKIIKDKSKSKEIKRNEFDQFMEKYQNHRYIEDDYWIQKNEGENPELSYEEYKNDLFELINDSFSLREIF